LMDEVSPLIHDFLNSSLVADEAASIH